MSFGCTDEKPGYGKISWYEISRTPNPWEFGTCTQVKLNPTNNYTYTMLWEQILSRNKYNFAVSTGTMENPTNDSTISLRFYYPPLPFITPLQVVDTDYNKTLVLHSCVPYFLGIPYLQFGSVFTEYAWILSRKRELGVAVTQRKRLDLSSFGVDVKWMQKVIHDDCDVRYKEIISLNDTEEQEKVYEQISDAMSRTNPSST